MNLFFWLLLNLAVPIVGPIFTLALVDYVPPRFMKRSWHWSRALGRRRCLRWGLSGFAGWRSPVP